MRAAAELAKIAGRAGQVRAQHRVVAAVGPGPDRIGRPKDGDDRPIERDGKMHRSGIVGHADRAAANERRKLGQRRFAGEVDRAGREACDLRADRVLAVRSDQRHGEFFVQEMPRHLGESVAAAIVWFPNWCPAP